MSSANSSESIRGQPPEARSYEFDSRQLVRAVAITALVLAILSLSTNLTNDLMIPVTVCGSALAVGVLALAIAGVKRSNDVRVRALITLFAIAAITIAALTILNATNSLDANINGISVYCVGGLSIAALIYMAIKKVKEENAPLTRSAADPDRRVRVPVPVSSASAISDTDLAIDASVAKLNAGFDRLNARAARLDALLEKLEDGSDAPRPGQQSLMGPRFGSSGNARTAVQRPSTESHAHPYGQSAPYGHGRSSSRTGFGSTGNGPAAIHSPGSHAHDPYGQFASYGYGRPSSRIQYRSKSEHPSSTGPAPIHPSPSPTATAAPAPPPHPKPHAGERLGASSEGTANDHIHLQDTDARDTDEGERMKVAKLQNVQTNGGADPDAMDAL